MKLTPAMRDALQAAKRDDELRRVHNPNLPGQPAWPAHPNTLAALVRRELVKRDRILNKKRNPVDRWQITDHGRQALEPPERRNEKRDDYLDRIGGTSQDPSRSIDYEWATTWSTSLGRRVRVRAPVASIDTNDLNPDWTTNAAHRHADAQPRRDRARRARAA